MNNETGGGLDRRSLEILDSPEFKAEVIRLIEEVSPSGQQFNGCTLDNMRVQIHMNEGSVINLDSCFDGILGMIEAAEEKLHPSEYRQLLEDLHRICGDKLSMVKTGREW